MVVLSPEQWLQVGSRIFVAAGASESNARSVTESLVDANLAGHDSHGVMRILQYIDAIESGELDPAGEPTLLRETPISTLIDGKWTFGQVGSKLAMQKAILKAKSQGMAISALVCTNHIGRLGEYSEMGHRADMISMVTLGGAAGVAGNNSTGVAPFGGAKFAFGTNPIAFGLPAGSQPPVMADFATASIAGGKIAIARAKKQPVPPGCLLDRNGAPSTDPEDFYNGGMLTPFGAHKGYGLAVAVELLGQALTGADSYADESRGNGTYARAGAIFLAIDPGLFRPVDGYKAAADAFLGKIKRVPPAEGFTEVLVPGEPEQRSKKRRRVEGISLPESTWDGIVKVGRKYGVDVAAAAV